MRMKQILTFALQIIFPVFRLQLSTISEKLKKFRNSAAYCCCLLPLFFTSCSQQKNRWINRAYHSTTTRYNIYFNGNESFKDGIFTIETANKDDYTKILPVFIYGDENTAKSAFPQMDNAIKKASKSVQRHSMYIKEVEYNEWIDDCYLLVGKSEFYKREYHKALLTFEYVAKDFKHKEIKHEAMLWLVRCYIELKDFDNANKFLNLVTADVVATEKGLAQKTEHKVVSAQKPAAGKKENGKNKKSKASSKKPSEAEQKKKELAENHVFPQRLKADYSGVFADFYIRQNNYSQAISELRNCISQTKKKKRRVRLLYILAQLYQKTGNYEMAVHHYSQVLKMRPPYEMEFYAQINRAMAYDVGGGSGAEIKAQLRKMMKDEKNKEFFDQIYYALADIEIKEGNEEKGIEYLKTSTQKSVSNNNQKGLSFLRLADIYFAKKNYQPAQANYDSAVTFLNKDREDYSNIVSQRNNLTKLVKNILIIEREDSLQRLSGLSEKERNKIIDEMIQKIIDDEDAQKQQQQQAMLAPQNKIQQQQNATTGTEWYFYNPATLGFGFAEFKKIWGDRIQEDNWRRKNKSIAAIGASGDDLVQLEDKDTSKANLKDRNYYLKNIPADKEKLNKSHNKMIDAYYDLGLVYREQFENNEMAKKTFETLISKYDTCRYVLPAYYQLYKIYKEEKNNEKAEYYKNKILKEFPESEYAKILLNPDYFVEIYKEKSKSEDLYKTTYQLYKEEYFSQVIANCDASDSLFPKNYLAPKFHFLKALSVGKSHDLTAFETALDTVIAKHPQSEEAAEAKKIIDLIQKKQIAEPKIDTSTAYLYQFKTDTKHSCVLIVPINDNADSIKNDISDFNQKFFSLAKLNISDALLDNDRQMISIKYFDDMASAVTYFKAFKNDADMLKNINAKNYTLFLISNENFPIFYTQKKLDGYFSFFTKNYPLN